jgi:hypothetical protein
VISLVITFFIAGCTSSQPDEKEIEQQAQKIAKRFNGKTIKLFEKWNFDRRGMWYRAVGNTAAYYGAYHPKEDSFMLKVLLNQQQVFLNDFPADYNLNDRQLRELYIREYNNEVNIQGSGDANKKYSLIEYMKHSTLFKTADPFDTFSQLYKLRDSLDFVKLLSGPGLVILLSFTYTPTTYLLTCQTAL